MRIAFGIVSLFPGGGLQRDCLEIAKLVRHEGHDVVVYACRIRDYPIGDEEPVILLQNGASTNHERQRRFAVDFLKATSGRYDLIVGFDKLLDLDVLYCADASVARRMQKNWFLYLLPRYRTFRKLETSSFAPNSKTQLILLSANQVIEYESAWKTELERMIVVPPTLSGSRRTSSFRHADIGKNIRALYDIVPNAWVWLAIGVQPRTKGIDRTIEALKKFPDAHLLIVGLNQTDRASEKLAERIQRLGVGARVNWLGYQENIPSITAAADLLVHPARYDTTGTVILEAIVNGLPVITTAACGYAHHVEAAGAGIVMREPFDFLLFVAALRRARDPAVRFKWSSAGQEYGNNPVLYKGRARAAEIIVRIGHGLPHEAIDTAKIAPLHKAVTRRRR